MKIHKISSDDMETMRRGFYPVMMSSYCGFKGRSMSHDFYVRWTGVDCKRCLRMRKKRDEK